MMNPWRRRHPLSILVYYAAAVFLMIRIRHPLLDVLIQGVALIHYTCLAGSARGLRMLCCSLGAALLCLVINPLLNHRGVTLLFLLGEQRITGEAVLYGAHMAVFLMASLLLFSCFSHYMTTERIMTLMGKRLPSFALLFSMILRFVPRAGRDFREMTALHGNRPAVWSALLGISLEDAVERSLSMRDRYYGSGDRSSYHARRLELWDGLLLLISVMTAAGVAGYLFLVKYRIYFFPRIHVEPLPPWMWPVLWLFYSLPLIGQGREELSWYLSRRRITGSTTRRRKNRQSISGH